MESPEHQQRAIREYMESQCAGDEKIVHLEKVSSASVLGTKYDVWDVHTDKGRWWVITNPANLYNQSDFPSLENALTFHIGLTHRVAARHDLPVSDDEGARFSQTLRRWKAAAAAFDTADEAEEFQAVGMRCRECLLALGFRGHHRCPTVILESRGKIIAQVRRPELDTAFHLERHRAVGILRDDEVDFETA